MILETINLSVAAPIPFDSDLVPSTFGACDRKGRCYWGRLRGGIWQWRYGVEPQNGFTHWLPANTAALPTRLPYKR